MSTPARTTSSGSRTTTGGRKAEFQRRLARVSTTLAGARRSTNLGSTTARWRSTARPTSWSRHARWRSPLAGARRRSLALAARPSLDDARWRSLLDQLPVSTTLAGARCPTTTWSRRRSLALAARPINGPRRTARARPARPPARSRWRAAWTGPSRCAAVAGARSLPAKYSSVVTEVTSADERPRQLEDRPRDVGERRRVTAVADVVGAVRRVDVEQVPRGPGQLLGEGEPADLVVDDRRG